MKIVFVDVDKTLVAKSTAILALKYFVKRGYAGWKLIILSIVFSILHYLNLADPKRMVQLGLEPFVGHSHSKIKRDMDIVFERHIQPLIYCDALDAINKHKNDGDLVLLLTSTSFDLAAPIARYLDIDYIAAEAVIENDTYTAIVVDPIPYGEGKLEHARRVCEEKGVGLEDCYFYTDSSSDMPLLEKVGHPKIVNPDPRLLREAKKRDWEILRFEKTLKDCA